MKILFLDIDGVLTNKKDMMKRWRENGKITFLYDTFCLKNVEILNSILKKTDAEIVLTSSWRILHTIEYMNNLFKSYGIVKSIIDYTPRIFSKERGYEIQVWLDNYKNMNIESFCIVDDEADMCHLQKYLVKTTWDNGLTKKHIKQIIKILEK